MGNRYDEPTSLVSIKSDDLNKDAFVKKRYNHLDGKRQSILTRCEQYAEWTLPSVFPRAGLNEDTELQLDYQSLGAEAVNNMANKLALTLLTPHRPFFRLNITSNERAALNESGMETPMIEAALAQVERNAMTELERIGVRTSTVDAAKLLLITGNALLHVPENAHDKAMAYSLRRYVIRRDSAGNPIEIIIRELSELSTFSEGDRQRIIAARELNEKEKPEVELFTYMALINKRWELVQAADDVTLEDSKSIYPVDKLPYIPLVWNRVDNESYGRGLVEDYAGDFHGFHGLSEAGANLTAIMCDIKFLSDPKAGNDLDTLNNSPSGTYVSGVPDTIGTSTSSIVQPSDMLEFYLNKYERRIGRAFLVNSSMVRDAERVTAEEIRFISEELQTAHGSVYANLSNTFQAHLAKLLLERLDFQLVDSEPTIVTGLDSLARSSDINNLRLWLQDMALLEQVPETLLAILKKDNIAAALAAGYGITHTDYVMSNEEQAQANEANINNQFETSAAESAGQQVGQQLPQG